LRVAIGDPGLHLVVAVGEIILGDVVGDGGPMIAKVCILSSEEVERASENG
jgi:hypothetical protein